MNLYQTVQYILSVAKAQPNVGLAYEGDVYDLNELQNIAYPAVVVAQNTHAENGEWRGYGFNIFYVDRLTDDKKNRLEIQNIALEALSNIYKVLVESGFEVQGEMRFHPFDERFDAECAGMYMELVLQSEESLCADGELPYIPTEGGGSPSWFNPADYYTSAQTNEKISQAVSAITASGVTKEELDEAIAAETARTEATYLKEHQSLEGYATENWVNEQGFLKEHQSLADYYTSGQTENAIQNAIAAETARTEQTYLKEHQSLTDYYTSAQTNNAISSAIDTESARTDTAIQNAMAAETARTEQTYVKQQSLNNYYTKTEVDSAITEAIGDIDLSNYYTSGQTDSAISTAVQDKVSSATIAQIWTGSQAQYDAMTGHSANILYIINS